MVWDCRSKGFNWCDLRRTTLSGIGGMADAAASKAVEETRVGSNPTSRTTAYSSMVERVTYNRLIRVRFPCADQTITGGFLGILLWISIPNFIFKNKFQIFIFKFGFSFSNLIQRKWFSISNLISKHVLPHFKEIILPTFDFFPSLGKSIPKKKFSNP